jgi:trimeric autotransporter adhesin
MQVFRKIIVSAIMMLAFVVCASAQVTVTNPSNTTPGLAATYTDLTSAITALNAQTAISGPVTIAVDPGNPQTAPSGGYSITALLTGASATNTVTIDGSGNTITAANPAGTAGNLNDGFFKFIGSDFMILQNFIMNENPLNTTTAAATNNMMEWGVALLYATSTNGAQNITVQNNTITLNRTYQNTFGIYSNSTHTAAAVTTSASATTTAGGNSGLKVYGNTISNVNNGIVVVGPTAAADANTGIDIGGTGGAQANTITNFGTTGTFSSYANVSGTVNGILVRNSNGTNVSFNTISSSVGGTTAGTLNGIQVPASSATPATTFTNTINSNSISLQSAVATGAIVGISYPSGSASTTSTLNINNNNFNTFGHTVAASGTITFITTASTNQFTTINGNTFTNMSVNTTGSVTFISQTFSLTVATGTKTVSGNSIVTGFTKTGAGGTVLLVTDNGSSVSGVVSNCQNNNFSNITLTGATTLTGLNYTDGGTAPTRTVSGNTLNNWTTGAATVNAMNFTYWNGTSSLSNNTVTNIVGQGAITGITIGATVNTATSATISSNTINNLVSSGTGGTVIGISSSNSSPAVNISGNTINTLSSTALAAVSGISVSGATNTSVFKNKIYDIANSNASGNVNGIVVSGGTTVSVFNNRVGDLRTPAANAANPLVGLNITGGTTVNAYFNTFYLNGASTGALFGSSAVSASTTPTVTLRNNVFVNTSTTAGTGLAVAYRRSTATLTTYAATSNNNDFFASTIYTDGVTPQATIAAYKALVASRDSNSFSENPPFISTTGSSPNFLQISLVTPTQLESGGTTVAGITDDFDGDTRNVTTPDIGADEFAGTPLDLSAPSIIYTPLANTAFTTNRNLTVTITDPSGVAGGVLAPRIYFKKSTDGVYVSTQCTGSSPTYTCTIDYALVGGGSITTGEILQYFVVAQDTAGNVGANPSGGFTATNVNTVTTPPTTPNQYTIVPAVSGNYNVGTAETITSLTNAGGIFDVINNGGVTGNVTISLTSDLTGESGTIALNQFTPGFTVTIKPSGAARTITGTGTNVSVIKLNGADNVDINGSLTESVVGTNGVDRSLTIINPNAATGTVAVFVGSIGAGAGANNVTIRNCVIQAGTKGTNAITTFGVFVGDTTGAAAGNDNDNFLFRNNQVKKTAIGIQAIGATTICKLLIIRSAMM